MENLNLQRNRKDFNFIFHIYLFICIICYTHFNDFFVHIRPSRIFGILFTTLKKLGGKHGLPGVSKYRWKNILILVTYFSIMCIVIDTHYWGLMPDSCRKNDVHHLLTESNVSDTILHPI